MADIAVIDYGAGNLRSMAKALEKVGAKIFITSDPAAILVAQGVVLPGVGAFGDAMEKLRVRQLAEVFPKIVAAGTPLLGVCLGLQVFFDEGEEMGLFEGLHLIPGRVVKFPPGEKVPQIGWNTIEIRRKDHYFFQGIPENTYVYFVHSYHPVIQDTADGLAWTTYGRTTYASSVGKGEVVATQFHPEKSGKWGLKMLENFVRHCSE